MKILALFASIIIGAFIGLKKRAGSVGVSASETSSTPFPIIETDVSEVSPDASVITTTETNPVSGVVSAATETISNVVSGTVAKVFGTDYDGLIQSAAIQYGIRPQILYNLLYAESHFRPDIITGKVRSSTGALGIAQFMPATAIQELGSINAAFDPNRAIVGAARYLAKLIRATGSETAGIAAYNWGVGNVTRKGLKNAPIETVRYVLAINGTDITKV